MDQAHVSYSEIQRRLEHHCAEAERLAGRAAEQEQRLREARRERALIERDMADVELAEPRVLVAAKIEAQQRYRSHIERAHEPAAVMSGALAWLSDIDRLNRAAVRAAGHAEQMGQRRREVALLVEELTLRAKAAQVAADSARQACLEARRALARRDEANVSQADDLGAPTGLDARLPGGMTAIEALLELREGLIARAYEAAALSFPQGHAFWSQFTRVEARAVAASLAVLGRGFDGRGGWQDGKPAEPRELALALSLAGREPRSVKHKPTRAGLETIWQGVTVAAVEHLHDNAPDLGIEAVTALLGPRAEGLSDLWDNWGRVRRLLLTREPAAD